jgi:hypothetical protein
VTRTFLGIDPGLGGALATFGPYGIETYDMPTFDIKGKRKLDIALLDNIVRGIVAVREPCLAVVEDVHSMPAQGVASSFSFGFVTGIVHALLAAHKVPLHLVSPAAWKRLMGLSADKDASRQRASRLFPTAATQWSRKRDDGRAEAALLAYYGSKLQ